MAFTFKLKTRDGAPADPPTLLTAAPTGDPATRSHSAVGRFESLRFVMATPTLAV